MSEPVDLEAIRARMTELAKRGSLEHGVLGSRLHQLVNKDIPALLREVERLQNEVAFERKAWIDAELQRGTTEAQRKQLEAEIATLKAPQPGTWGWALEQMKAGKRVRHSRLDAPLLLRGQLFLLHYPPQRPWYPSPWDFEATDWQIVEEQQ